MSREIILNKLNELKAKDYRVGFDDSVLNQICNAIGNKYERGTEASELWTKICCGYRTYIAETYGQDVQDLYNDVDKMSHKEGAFVMPDWGTYGT